MTRLRRTRRALAKARRPSTSARLDPGSLLDFVAKLQPRYEPPKHLAPLADVLERAPDGGLRVVVSVPPRFGKTELILASFIWHLLQRPHLQFMYLSYGGRLAHSKSGKARLLARQAGVQLDESTQSKAEWLTPEGGGLRASGMNQAVTGQGADVLVIDDPHRNRLDAESAVKRDQAWDLYTGTAETRLEPNGSVIICQQRWHEDDVAGRALATGEFIEINLAAIDESTGSSLWPSRWPVKNLHRIRKLVGEYNWVSQYQGRPMRRGGKVFADVQLTDAKPTEGIFVIGLDLAHTARTSSDWSAAVVMCREPSGRITVVDVEHAQERLAGVRRDGKLVEPGFNRRIARLMRLYPGARVVWKIGGKEDVIAELMAELKESPVPIETVPSVTNKYVNASAFATAWNDGDVFVLNAEWTERYVKQHISFTGNDGEEDDLVDASVAAFDQVNVGPAPHVDYGGGERRTAGLRGRYT